MVKLASLQRSAKVTDMLQTDGLETLNALLLLLKWLFFHFTVTFALRYDSPHDFAGRGVLTF